MAYSISLPFFAVKLHFHSGGTMLTPLTDNEVIHVNQSIPILAGKFAEAFQRKVLNQGTLIPLMDELLEGDFFKASFPVSFEAAKDGRSFPRFELEFDYYYQIKPHGTWAYIPVLGIESFAEEPAKIDKVLAENVRLEFARNKRLLSVQGIVSAIWFDTIELLQTTIDLKVLNPQELEDAPENERERWLPKVAKVLQFENRVVYGRKKELAAVTKALENQFNKNFILVGPSGSGKTAIVWEISRYLKTTSPEQQIWETSASTMIKELTADTGWWEENFSTFCKELSSTGQILFVRNLLELFEVGQSEGNAISMAEYLRNYLSRSEIQLISECTEEELARIELRSPSFLSHFQIIRLEEPRAELEEIIIKKVKDLANLSDIVLEQDAIEETIRLNRRYTPYSGMPGKPIRFLESILLNSKVLRNSQEGASFRIDKSEVINYFCEETGMPKFMVDPNIPLDLQEIKNHFNQEVFGQKRAVDDVVNLLASIKTALTRTGKPIASFLFVGPTGVGKTELAKVLSEFMFGSRLQMTRFDMSEFSSPYAVLRLTGTSYTQDGLLTSAVRRTPFSVLLFDEIEKAHANFYDLLLQILSEGRLTDSQGKLVNFCSTIIIMTSNIGAANLQGNRITWKQGIDHAEINDYFKTAVEKHFRPELYNRMDSVIAFDPLSPEVVRFVVDREINLLKKREGIRFRRMDFKIGEKVFDFLAAKGYDHKYGARQLQRTIRERLMIPLAKVLNLEDVDDQLLVNVEVVNDEIKIEVGADPLALELLIEELDKINYADHASELRRKINRLKEGQFYIQLLSRLDILEAEKRKKANRFWGDVPKANQYSYYLETKVKVEELCQQIEKLEMDFSLSCINVQAYQPNLTDTLETWKKDFHQMKIEIFSRLYPQANLAYLAIYGSDIKRILNFYLDLFETQKFDFTANLVWFRESYFNEEILVTVEEIGAEGEAILTERKQKRQAYLKRAYTGETSIDFVPEKKKDFLLGIEFMITGVCAHLYLSEETGLQEWKKEQNDSQFYQVFVSEELIETPVNINRKDFFKKKNVRRTVAPGHLKDTVLKINREITKTGIVALIKEKLDENFILKLDAVLL